MSQVVYCMHYLLCLASNRLMLFLKRLSLLGTAHALESFLFKLKANPVIRKSHATTLAGYSSYDDNMTIRVTSNATINGVNKEIRGYETVVLTPFNCDKSVRLGLDARKGVSLHRLFS